MAGIKLYKGVHTAPRPVSVSVSVNAPSESEPYPISFNSCNEAGRGGCTVPYLTCSNLFIMHFRESVWQVGPHMVNMMSVLVGTKTLG